MTIKKHGFVVGVERVQDRYFVYMKAVGKLTHEDYEKMTPMLDAALAKVTEPRVRVLIDATELEGWEPRAAWDDFKLGLKHGNQFEKIAIVGNKKWEKFLAKMANWFVAGEVRFFENLEDAMEWLAS